MDNVEKVARAIFRAMHPHAVRDWSNQGRYKEAAQAALQSIGYERMREALEAIADRLMPLERDGNHLDNISGRARAMRETILAALKGDSDRAALNRGEVG